MHAELMHLEDYVTLLANWATVGQGLTNQTLSVPQCWALLVSVRGGRVWRLISINESMLPSVCYTVMYVVRVGGRVGLGLV